MWGPMAVAVIFGLAVATVLTLVVVPAMFSAGDITSATVHRFKKWVGFVPKEQEAGLQA